MRGIGLSVIFALLLGCLTVCNDAVESANTNDNEVTDTGQNNGSPADERPPETQITNAPEATSSSGSVSISFVCDEDVCTFACSLNDAGFESCSSPKTYAGLSDGAYNFKVRAIDAAGNVDASPAQADWTVDLTVPDTAAPNTVIDSAPAPVTTATGATFYFSCNELNCTYACRLDGLGWGPCTSPKTYTALAATSHTFEVRGYDAALNVDAVPASFTWTIEAPVLPDLTAPDTVIDSAPSVITAYTDAGISFHGTDNVGVEYFECRIDGGAWYICTSPKSYAGLMVTSHTFEVRAYDAAENVDDSPASWAWTISEPTWALIPGGCFAMGDALDGIADALPVRNVCVTTFRIKTHEVTNEEYKACVVDGGCSSPGTANSYSGRAPYYGSATYASYPVVYVNHPQAAEYCTWEGGRLATEAEWEYAARGGLVGKRFPWDDTISCALANYSTSDSYAYDVDPYVGGKGCAFAPSDTTEVGYYAPNAYGLYDMAGNVAEWVADWYGSTYYTGRPDPDNDPTGPASGTKWVVRGGNFNNLADIARVAARSSFGAGFGGALVQRGDLGFRCVR